MVLNVHIRFIRDGEKGGGGGGGRGYGGGWRGRVWSVVCIDLFLYSAKASWKHVQFSLVCMLIKPTSCEK